jgi:hypothetical protein
MVVEPADTHPKSIGLSETERSEGAVEGGAVLFERALRQRVLRTGAHGTRSLEAVGA